MTSAVSFTLNVDTEKLELSGTQAIDGTGSASHDRILGNTAANVLLGLDGDDKLFGRAGADRIEGGYGADWLDGGSGDDQMSGGEGYEVFVFASTYDSRTTEADRMPTSCRASITSTSAASMRTPSSRVTRPLFGAAAAWVA